MDPLTITLLAIVGLLLGVLIYFHFQRLTAGTIKERQWLGHGFDTASVRPRIKRLRSDYISALRSRHLPKRHREQSLAATRLAVSYLGFFRHRQYDPNDAGES